VTPAAAPVAVALWSQPPRLAAGREAPLERHPKGPWRWAAWTAVRSSGTELLAQDRAAQNRGFWWEGACSGHPVRLPGGFRAGRELKHVVKGIAQTPLRHGQAWGIACLSQKPVPGSDRPLSEEMLPGVPSDPPRHSFAPLPGVLFLGTRERSSAPPSARPRFGKLQRAAVPRMEGTTAAAPWPPGACSCRAAPAASCRRAGSVCSPPGTPHRLLLTGERAVMEGVYCHV